MAYAYSIGANEYPSIPVPETPVTTIPALWSEINLNYGNIVAWLTEFNGGIRALLYSYGGQLIVARTNKCYRYALTPDQGKNWSEFYGEGWVFPEAQVNGVKIFSDKDQPFHIALDASTGLFYRFATRNGPVGSGITKLFRDKIGGEYTPGIEIPWEVGFKEHRGTEDYYLIKFIFWYIVKVENSININDQRFEIFKTCTLTFIHCSSFLFLLYLLSLLR